MNKIGAVSPKLKSILALDTLLDENIYIGKSNIEHMEKTHPQDFEKYKDDIEFIIKAPDYVGINPKDNSIEYVKEYKIDNEFTKVAVRVSTKNKYFVRSIYTLNNKRVQNFIKANKLKRY